MPRKTKEDLKIQFEDNRKVTPTGCWEWTGSRLATGYGDTWYEGKHYRVHRLSLKLYLDISIDEDSLVLHKCDNKLCFNPDHLYIGNHAQNNRDKLNHRGNVCKYGHIGFMLVSTQGQRFCKVCAQIRDSKRNRKK